MADVKCELYHDNFQNHRRYNIAPAQLMICDIPYNIGTNFYASRADWYKDGDRSNGESEKAHKAIYTEGPCFLNILAPCPRGWRYEAEDLAKICKMAVDTCVWPMYEIENGIWRLTYEPRRKLPVEDFLSLQGRFRHMFKKGNEWMIRKTQEYVDEQWEKLVQRCE